MAGHPLSQGFGPRAGDAGTRLVRPKTATRGDLRLLLTILAVRPQKPLSRRPKPKAASVTVGYPEDFLDLPNGPPAGEQLGCLLEDWRL